MAPFTGLKAGVRCHAVQRLLVLVCASPLAIAQPNAPPSAFMSEALADDAPLLALPAANEFRTRALLAASIGGTLAYGRAKWWQDGFSGGFKSVKEGWFGQDTAYGGADKLGHAMFAYSGARLLTQAFQWAGNDADTALKLGLWTSVGTLMGVELIDGFSKKWRFSKEDALANLAGGALAFVMERHPEVDALLDLRLQYSPSPESGRFDPFGDYSGQRYLLVLKASGVPPLRQHPLLKYLEFNVGYGTRNFDRDIPALAPPTRHTYVGISINLTELLRSTAYRSNATPSRTQRVTETFFEYVQIPAATAQTERVLR